MKNLYLVRHAKSSWKFPELNDFERPLNKRGKRDVPLMGRFLKKKNIKPDIIISSPANRAATTTSIIAKILKYPTDNILYDDTIYDAGMTELLKTISNIREPYLSAMIVGHNPGLTFLANHLGNFQVINIPTCGIYAIDLNIQSWNQVASKCGTFKFLEIPKGQS